MDRNINLPAFYDITKFARCRLFWCRTIAPLTVFYRTAMLADILLTRLTKIYTGIIPTNIAKVLSAFITTEIQVPIFIAVLLPLHQWIVEISYTSVTCLPEV